MHKQVKLSQFNRRFAFSLVEILVVVTIVVILVVLLFPSLRAVRDSALRASCQAALHHLHQALVAYAVDHDHCFPPGNGNMTWPTALGEGNYITQESKYDSDAYCPATRVNASDPLFERDPATFRTDYSYNKAAMNNGTPNPNNLMWLGSRMVLLFDGNGGEGTSAATGNRKARRRHAGTFNVIFLDGHIEALKDFETNAPTSTIQWKRP